MESEKRHRAGVGIWDPLPSYSAGLVAAFHRAGLSAETPSDLVDWSERHELPRIVLTLGTAKGSKLLRRLSGIGNSPVIVAVLPELSPEKIKYAWGYGALSLVERTCPPEVIVNSLALAARSYAVVSTRFIGLVRIHLPAGDPGEVSFKQQEWLRALARGDTIEKIARSSDCSTREMYRGLTKLYRQLGARNRAEAMAIAGRNGII